MQRNSRKEQYAVQ